MTPTEIKAKEKAEGLIHIFKNPKPFDKKRQGVILHKEVVINLCLECCDQVLETLNSIKGRGKIHKISFWKKVKENLENEN